MRIHIDLGYVESLEHRCRLVANELRTLRYGRQRFDEAPPVAMAMESFHTRWDANRDKIGEGLDTLEETFRIIRKSFEAADHELSGSLGGAES